MDKYNYKMNLCYDGTKYFGWQKNKNAEDTIQGKMNETLTKYFGETVELIAAGRTDKGVHALNMTTNFFLSHLIDVKKARIELNSYLPADISILLLEETDLRFHARFQAKSKTYRYVFYKEYNGTRPVFDRFYKSPLYKPVDLKLMKQAADLLTGTHDFKGFSSDPTKKSTLRTLDKIDIIETDTELILEFTGDGFLYNMVRILVGTLVEIGQSTLPLSVIDSVFSSKIRSDAGYLAKARGLTLIEVYYD